jgi:hypothetical protein
MRSRYDQARRTHVAPVFDGAEPVRRLATPRQGDVVVFVIDHNGEIVARADGAATAPVITRLRSLLPH